MKKREIDYYMKQLAVDLVEDSRKEYESADDEKIFSNRFYESIHSCLNEGKAERKRKFTYRLATTSAVALLVCAILFGVLYVDTDNAIAGEITYNLMKLSEMDWNMHTSSNPYAYKDTENYRSIVNMGPIAIVILDEKYYGGELGGIQRYLAGTAMEDVANIKMMNVTGQSWSSGEEFFVMWQKMIMNLPQTFKEITESSQDVETKMALIREYGLFGKFYLQYMNKTIGDEISFLGCDIRVSSVRNAVDINEELSRDDYLLIKKYLEKKLDSIEVN